MNYPAHKLSLVTSFVCLIMGLAELFRIGPRFLPPSWVQVYDLLPYGEWWYPGTYVLAGVIALVGFRVPTFLRWGYQLSGALFLIWCLAGAWATIIGAGGNIQGTLANLLLATDRLTLGYYVTKGVQSDRIDAGVAKLGEQIDQENER